MCSPALALGGQAFGAGMSTVGTFASASMQRASLRSQARLSEINATMSDAAARAELAASERQQQAIRLKGANTKGAARAAIAAGGVDLGSASAQAALTTTDYFTEADAITAEANGVRAAWGHRIDAGNQRRAAGAQRATAAGVSPGLAAATSLIGGATDVASSWYSFGKAGAFGKKSGDGGKVTTGGWW